MKSVDITQLDTAEIEYIEKTSDLLRRVSKCGCITTRLLGYGGVATGLLSIAEGLKNNNSDSVRFDGALIGFSAFSYPVEKLFLSHEHYFQNQSNDAICELTLRTNRKYLEAVYGEAAPLVQDLPPEF